MQMTDGPWFEKYIVRDPEVLSGTPVIAGTRLPAAVVATNVKAGMSIEQVVAAFPSINAEQAQAAVEFVRAYPGPYIPEPNPFWRSGKPKFSTVVKAPQRKPRE